MSTAENALTAHLVVDATVVDHDAMLQQAHTMTGTRNFPEACSFRLSSKYFVPKLSDRKNSSRRSDRHLRIVPLAEPDTAVV